MKALSALLILAVSLPAWSKDYKKTEDIINIILGEKENTETQPAVQPEDKKPGADKKKAGKEASKPSAEDPAQVLVKNGIRLYNSGLYDGALASFQEVVNNHPDSPLKDQARIWSGRIQIRQYKYDEAISSFSAVPADSGEYPAAIFHSAESYAYKREMIKAAEFYQRVAAQFPEHDQADNALFRAGSIYLEEKRGNQALENTVRLIRFYRDRETIDDAYYLLGKIFEKDQELMDLETSRKVYRLFLKKASAGEAHFGNSPLRDRVKSDLERIEKSYLMMEE